MKISESQMIANLRKGDKLAFTKFFYFYKDKLYGFLKALTGDEEKACDLVQDIFLKLWQNKENIPEIDNFDAYIFSVAKNSVVDNFRRIAKETLILQNLSMERENEKNTTPEDELIKKELNEK